MSLSEFELGLQGRNEYFTQPELVRAKKGVRDFQEVITARDSRFRHYLLHVKSGQQFQPMFLGIKPASRLETPQIVSYEEQDRLIRDKMGDRFKKYGLLVYEPAQLAEKMKAYPDYFPEYVSGKVSVDGQVRLIADARLSYTKHMQYGLMFGYPPQAVLDFARYATESSDKSEVPADAHVVTMSGFTLTHFPTSQHETDVFRQRVEGLFEASGMNAFLLSIDEGNTQVLAG